MNIPAYLSLSRHNVYYFRWPLDAKRHPEKRHTHIRLSLDTRCPRLALRMMRDLVYVGQTINNHPALTHMTFEEIREALMAHFKAEREAIKQRILQLGQLQGYEVDAFKHKQQLAADALKVKNFLALDIESALPDIFPTVGLRPNEAHYETVQTQYATAYRDFCGSIVEYNARFNGFNFRTDPTSIEVRKVDSLPKLKLTNAIDQYITSKLRYESWTSESAESFRSQLALMAEFLGEDASIHISKQTALDVKSMLEKIPSRAKVLPQYKGIPLRQLLELNEVKRMNPRTINKHLQTYLSFYDWSVKEGKTSENPFKNLIVKLKDQGQVRDAFSSDQIQMILNAVLDGKDQLATKAYQKWGTLIGLYTGARLEEVCQIELADILQIEGIWCFSINDMDDKQIKNSYSKRLIPIHSKLIEHGILDLMLSVKNSGSTRLLHELPYTGRNGYGRNLSRWFNEKLLVKLGIKTDRLVFHSLRHTVYSSLLKAGVDDPICKTIVGHSMNSDIGQKVYAKGYKVGQLQSAIEMLNYKVKG